MNKKLELVDFLRGFSIFTIALMHLVQGTLTGALNKAVSFGGAGVHVFIVVSGFGLYLSYKKKPLRYGDFLRKRFSKVYWPYAIVVLVCGLWTLFCSGTFPLNEVASHLLLYKMFDANLDVSLCYPFWFISTIVQFYLCWPLLVLIFGNRDNSTKGLALAIGLSLAWATLVAILGYEDMRPWGSCFLQYLWEFVLGMWLADKYASSFTKFNSFFENPNILKWWWLIGGVVVGVGLTGIMGWAGGVLKLYNDFPSLMGYLSMSLIVYKVSCSFRRLVLLKKIFIWTSGFGYELYLVHSLVYSISAYLLKKALPLCLWIVLTFVIAYVVAWCFSCVIKKMRTSHQSSSKG